MKPETKKLVDEANRLHAVFIETKEAKNRYWAAYQTLADAVEAAPDQAAWKAARARFLAHSKQEAPCTYDLADALGRARRTALAALAAEAGLNVSEIYL